MDMFTKVLAKLLNEHETNKPDDAIEYIRQNIGDSLNDKNTIQSMRQEIDELQKTIEELRRKLSQYEQPIAAVTEAVVDSKASSEPAVAVAFNVEQAVAGDGQQQQQPAIVDEPQPTKEEDKVKQVVQQPEPNKTETPPQPQEGGELTKEETSSVAMAAAAPKQEKDDAGAAEPTVDPNGEKKVAPNEN